MRLRPALFATALAAALAMAAQATASPGPVVDGLKPLRVVMLMRHGVRPPTRAVVIPEGYARQPWTPWDTAPGLLTAHGYQGEVRLGAYDRMLFADEGLAPTDGCPAPGTVRMWADTDQRTRETGRAWLEGFAPGCNIAVGHSNGQRDDPLFASIDLGLTSQDQATARSAVEARAGGDLDGTMPAVADAFERLNAILDCCSVATCAEFDLTAECGLGDIPHRWEATDPKKRVDFEGPLAIGGTAGQSIMLQFMEGLPMAEVGWGRASEADILALSRIHAAEFDLLARTPYIADRAATPIMREVLDTFADDAAARVTGLVGHDTNISNLGGMLDLHWRVAGYAADDPAVGGMLGFVLLTAPDGERFVRVFYQAQSPRQLRDLQTLNRDTPPGFAWLEQPLCGLPEDRTLCRAEAFAAAVQAKLTP
jgi:4-phytase/acid phosphatase